MAKKSGWVGSKAFTKSDCLQGSRNVSAERMPMPKGEMSSKQIVSHTPGKSYDMHHAGDRIGSDKKTFSSGIPGEAPANHGKHGKGF